MEKYLIDNGIEITNDTKILATAFDYYQQHNQNFYFITNDLSLKTIAKLYFKDNAIISIDENIKDEYTGYLEIRFTDEEMAYFYSNPIEYGKKLKILTNQYLNIYNMNNECVDTLCWTGENFRPLKYKVFSSQ